MHDRVQPARIPAAIVVHDHDRTTPAELHPGYPRTIPSAEQPQRSRGGIRPCGLADPFLRERGRRVVVQLPHQQPQPLSGDPRAGSAGTGRNPPAARSGSAPPARRRAARDPRSRQRVPESTAPTAGGRRRLAVGVIGHLEGSNQAADQRSCSARLTTTLTAATGRRRRPGSRSAQSRSRTGQAARRRRPPGVHQPLGTDVNGGDDLVAVAGCADQNAGLWVMPEHHRPGLHRGSAARSPPTRAGALRTATHFDPAGREPASRTGETLRILRMAADVPLNRAEIVDAGAGVTLKQAHHGPVTRLPLQRHDSGSLRGTVVSRSVQADRSGSSQVRRDGPSAELLGQRDDDPLGATEVASRHGGSPVWSRGLSWPMVFMGRSQRQIL